MTASQQADLMSTVWEAVRSIPDHRAGVRDVVLSEPSAWADPESVGVILIVDDDQVVASGWTDQVLLVIRAIEDTVRHESGREASVAVQRASVFAAHGPSRRPLTLQGQQRLSL